MTDQPAVDHHTAALDAIREARTADPALGQVYALTAIAHALLARQEKPRPEPTYTLLSADELTERMTSIARHLAGHQEDPR